MKNKIFEIFQLFEVQESSDVVAAIMYDKAITYQELLYKAKVVCQYLYSHGFRKGDKIGVYLENSFETIFLVLASIMFGYVFVPISYELSYARVSNIAKSCDLKCIFVQASKINSVKNLEITLFCFEEDESNEFLTKIKFYGEVVPISLSLAPEVGLEDTAYILYTSGSTGHPKGVEITYASLMNYVSETNKILLFNSSSRVMITNSFAFDASLGYIYSSFLVHGCLVLLNHKLLMPRLVTDSIIKFNITHFPATPSFLANFLKYIYKKEIDLECTSLKTLSFGAENPTLLQVELIKKCKQKYPHIRMFNRYGPTETTVCSSCYEVEVNDLDYFPIGKPYKNVEYYLVNQDLESIETGEMGELLIGGIQNMRGYYNDAELSEKVMITLAGKCLYRTNDLFLLKPNGDVVFVSRLDNMLKRNGKRIYLSEMEMILQETEGVLDAICMLDKRNIDNAIVYAFLVMREGVDLDRCEKKLRAEYPSYMLPNFFCETKSIPLNSNGKRDPSVLMNSIKGES